MILSLKEVVIFGAHGRAGADAVAHVEPETRHACALVYKWSRNSKYPNSTAPATPLMYRNAKKDSA